MSSKDVALAVFDYYRPFFDQIGEPILKLHELFGFTSPLTLKKCSRKKIRRHK